MVLILCHWSKNARSGVQWGQFTCRLPQSVRVLVRLYVVLIIPIFYGPYYANISDNSRNFVFVLFFAVMVSVAPTPCIAPFVWLAAMGRPTSSHECDCRPVFRFGLTSNSQQADHSGGVCTAAKSLYMSQSYTEHCSAHQMTQPLLDVADAPGNGGCYERSH